MKRPFYMLMLSAVCLLVLPALAEALTVEQYCQLTLEILQMSVGEAGERLEAVHQHATDPSAYFSQLQLIEEKYESLREQLYKKYGTTRTAYLGFMQENRTPVNSFIQSHPEVKAQVDSLTGQVASLSQQHEAAIVNAGLHRVSPFVSRPESK